MSYLSHLIPGSYPDSSRAVERQPSSMSLRNTTASAIIDKENANTFEKKQVFNQRRKLQHNLISQLDTSVYFLVGYQFIKYCHSACIVPAIFHIAIQKFLGCDSVASSEGVHTMMAAINYRAGEDSEARNKVIRAVISKTSLTIYCKSVFTFLYHILFVGIWVLPVVTRGTQNIENGTWWFVSFIGEGVTNDIESSSNTWIKLAKLGLPGLLLTDLLILLIQLILYQCIFKQSNLIIKDRILNENENENEEYVLRSSAEQFSNVNLNPIEDDKVPMILTVKLFEAFDSKSFRLNP
ncbi:uncharacterized protein PRCAT00005553001 [Priceomyces carsonii]|uniref:uncharacterized protein n=1 Tax=Priceomyces carsonii TaxID=28549 RepID=UPI002EDAA6C2|nr:unnamed protein product [Priceomyces carsonii]